MGRVGRWSWGKKGAVKNENEQGNEKASLESVFTIRRRNRRKATGRGNGEVGIDGTQDYLREVGNRVKAV